MKASALKIFVKHSAAGHRGHERTGYPSDYSKTSGRINPVHPFALIGEKCK
jgi:hypothetical protein